MSNSTPPSAIDARSRSSLIRNSEEEVFDLLIIGGGITGAGVARDAAMRGLRVALLEANDFASGTSSRSSKMVHGGLRYLAQGHVRLVQETASERLHVRRIAPHLAQLAPFVLPYKSIAARTKLKAALVMFEKLGDVPKHERHEAWSKAQLQSEEPELNAEHLGGAIVYNECLTDDARLTLANLRSAKAHGAHILSHMKVIRFMTEGGKAVGAVAKGQLPDEDEEITVKARQIVNAAGPWVDEVLKLEGETGQARLQLTKGIHFVVKHDKLPVNRTIIVPAADKRSVFAVPRDGFTYFGTSDTFYSDAEYWPDIDLDSVEYLLAACTKSFHNQPLTISDIQSAWSGVRPLIAQEGKSPSEISREEEIWDGQAGVITIAGGKLSAYRKMAERITDMVQEKLGQGVSQAHTHEEPLPGGGQSIESLQANSRLSEVSGSSQLSRLVRLYGDEVFGVVEAGGDLSAEIHQAVTREGALRLQDYWARRSARAWFSNAGGQQELERASNIMGDLLGWSSDRKTLECDACKEIHQGSLAFQKLKQQ